MARKKWNYDSLLEDASNYSSLKDWREKSSSYDAAYRRGFHRKIASEFGWGSWRLGNKRKKRKWCYDSLFEDASNYSGLYDWDKNSSGYEIARQRGWSRKIAAELGWIIPKEWDYDSLLEDASNYSGLGDWRKNGSGYHASQSRGWSRKIAAELGWSIRKEWKYDSILEDASNYSGLGDWSKNSSGYQAAYKRGWARKIAAELGWIVGVPSGRPCCIYKYMQDDYAYVGITNDQYVRHYEHESGIGSIVNKYIEIDFGILPDYYPFNQEEDAFMPRVCAESLERALIIDAAKRGLKVINKAHNPQWDGTKYSWEEE